VVEPAAVPRTAHPAHGNPLSPYPGAARYPCSLSGPRRVQRGPSEVARSSDLPSDARLLLGNTVDAAAVGEDLAGVDEFHGALGEGLGEDLGGLLVAGVVEGAEDDRVVAQVVVDVRPVDRLAAELVGDRGRGDLDDLQRAAVRVGRGAQQGDDLPGDLVVRVGRVGLVVRGDDAGPEEGGDDVDVATGAVGVVVAGEAARQPDRLAGAELGVDLRLGLLAGQAGVAARVELDGLGEQHGALAVHVDAAALVDQG